MKKPIPWLFPIALAVGWVTTSGYVLSRLASLHTTLAQQSAHWRPDVAFSSGVAVGTFSCDDPGRGARLRGAFICIPLRETLLP
jgi:hypothetical protein